MAEKVKFLQQDLFETDIHEATVVTLFLLPEVNLRLRPKLLRDLEPGSYDVDIAGIRDHYLMKNEKKGLMALLSRLTTRN